MSDARPSWDVIGMGLARQIAARSLCTKRQVGAAIASEDRRHWALGYNGPPAGFRTHDGDGSALPCSSWCPQGMRVGETCHSVHAEINAIAQSDRAMRQGGTFYVTAAPCHKCLLAVLNSGVSRIVSARWEPDRTQEYVTAAGLAKACGVELVDAGPLGDGRPR